MNPDRSFAPECRYQSVVLEDGTRSPGSDRSELARVVLPADLTGASVLDVGCNTGARCHEALRRGAARVRGIDVSPAAIRRARTLAGSLGLDLELEVVDIDDGPLGEPLGGSLGGPFDHVLAMNVLHHCRNPLRALRTLALTARKSLTLEVADVSNPAAKPRLGERWLTQRLRAAASKEAVAAVAQNQTLLSEAAIYDLLVDRWRLFAHVEFRASTTPGSFVVVATRRLIDRLVLLAGPSCAGKTHLMRRFRAGDPEACRALGIQDPQGWETINLGRIQERRESHFERVVLHVDTMKTRFGEAQTPAGGHVEDLMASAERVRVVTLQRDARTLRRQLNMRCSNDLDFPQSRVRRLRDYYASDDLLREHYDEWSTYCAARGLSVTEG